MVPQGGDGNAPVVMVNGATLTGNPGRPRCTVTPRSRQRFKANTRCCGAGPEESVLPLCPACVIGFVPWCPFGVQFLTGAVDANYSLPGWDIRKVESRFSPEQSAPQPGAPHMLDYIGESDSVHTIRTRRTQWSVDVPPS